jgi:hypothetical protein
MRILEVIPSRVWVNVRTGAKASPYGASPWPHEGDKANWELRDQGWTWRNDNGTVGLGRVPAKTREEALEVMRAHNARMDENKARYAAPVKSYEDVVAEHAARKGRRRRGAVAVASPTRPSMPPGTKRG